MKDSELIFGLMNAFSKDEYSFSDIILLTNPFDISETNLCSCLSRMASKKPKKNTNPSEVTITFLLNGYCPGRNIVYERVKRVIAEFGTE